jgi:lambda family phage tail tape measure protein
MGATQAAGAVISGGIFGGPEGAIGGIAGTIAGGVPGAFAGAAAGAQLGIMRKALGEMASFTAEIDKQRIALRSVVGSQEQYQQALQFIDATSRRAAIPHDQLTRQFTQLAASVIGAGGNVNVAERAFRGMAAGIRGTGGSLEAMQSAMLATSQVFSKGKVSAEEIRQQIGERLPGAFTTFATAIGKTPAMLDKMLQKGEVTLDDFMLLIEELIKTYEPSMDRIAASSQAAGDRMQVTFARLREAIGRELQPVGAQFQEIFANFFEENEQAIVNFASSIAGLARSIADNAGTIAESLKVLIGLAGIAGSAFAFTKVAAGVTFVAAAIFQMGGVASVASLAVTTLKTALIAIPGVNVFAGAIAGLALLGKAVYDTNDTFRNFVDNIGGVIASDFKNSVDGMAADASTAAGNIQTAYEDLTAKLDPIGNFIKQLFKDVFKDTSDSAENSATASSNAFDKFFSGLSANAAGAFNGLNTIISNWWSGLPAPIRSIFEGNAASLLIGAGQYAANLPGRTQRRRPSYVLGDKQQGPAVPLGLPNRNKRPSTDLPFSSTSAPGVSGATNAKDAAALAAEQQRLAETVMQQRLRIEDTLFKHQVELDRKRYDLQKQLNDQQTQNRIAAETGVQRSVTADFQQLKQRLREITERQTQANDRVRLAEQALKTASAMASVTTGGPSAGMAGIYRQGSIGPTSTGPHFDIKRSDGGFYGRTALDKYVSVNGQPLSSGVTVPGGEYGARRSYGGHAGRDYAFGAGAGLSLMGGAQWVGNRPGTAHGDETAFRTPDGKVYKILHGKFEQAGVAAQQRRGVKAEGTAGVESIDLQAAQRERQLEKEFEAPQRQEAIRSFILQQTDAIREQNATMQNSIELEVKRASLLGQGYGPERIESMMKVAELEQLRSQRVAKLGELARSNPEMTGELTTAIGEVNAEYTNLIATIERLYEIQSSPQARLQQAVGAVRQELATLTDPVNQIVGAANAIGSSFGSAFKGLVSGSMSAKEALASFFQSTADYFLDMASKIITQWITMTILNSVLKLFPGGAGAAGGGLAGSSLPGGFANPLVGAYTNANGNAFAANGIVPYAKGGIVNSPTLFKFAKGGAMQTGIMGEAGAEAVMPLKRGPDGKLGVAATGGGGVNVVVNVDAKGSAVQGDQGQGNELGRVIAGAVQAELIKQQRPGGLLTR